MSKSREKLFIWSLVAIIVATMAFFAYLLHVHRRSRNNAPTITCASDEIHVSVNATKEDLLTGVAAMDAEDGNLTDSVVVGNRSSFMEKGTCEITYAVFDSGNKVATAKRRVYFTDYYSPRFALSDDLIFQNGETISPLKSITAYDCMDGDITNRISMEWIENDSASKIVEYRVINSMGDLSTLRANITVEEKYPQNTPVIALREYLIYINQGETVDPLEYIKSITVGRNAYTLDEYDSELLYFDFREFDSSVPGVHRIKIYCANGDYTGDTELLVVVND